MADAKARIVLTAQDDTRAAFNSVKQHLGELSASASRLSGLAGIGAAFAGAFSGVALTAGIKSVIDGADELNKAGQKYGVAVEQLSALKYAGALAGVSLEAIGTGLKKLSVNMLDTAAGTGDAKDAFKALNISVKESDGSLKSSDKVLGEIADRFAGMEDGAGKTALAVKLFGRAGADMIPLLNQGSRGLNEMKEEAKALGVIVGGDLAKKSEEFNDNLTRIGYALEAVKISLAGGVIDKLNDLASALVASTIAAGGFWKGLLLLGGDQAENPVAALEKVEQGLERVRKIKAEIEASSANKSAFRDLPFIGTAGDIENLNAQIASLEKQRQALAYLSKRRGADDFGPPVWEGAKQKAPIPVGDKKKEADDELRQMRERGKEYERMFESAEKYVAGLDAQIAKGRALTQAEQQLLEIERQLPKEWAGAIKPLLERADALEKQKKNMEEGKKLYEDTRTPMEQLAATETHLAELLDAGAITWDTYARAVFDAQDKIKETKKPLDEMTEFVREAARNMQDAMADGFFDIMQGKFDDLGASFKTTIDRMVANLLASQFMNFLTGDFGKTGKLGGFIGNLLPSFDVGTDFVPRTGPAIVHRGERIIPAAQNRAGAGGMTIVNNFTLNQPADRRTQEQIAALAGASIQTAMARGA